MLSPFSFPLILPHHLLKTFLSNVASRLAISLFSVHYSAPYVAIGLVYSFYFFRRAINAVHISHSHTIHIVSFKLMATRDNEET